MGELSNRDKGAAFERLVQLYLQTQPEYRTTLRAVWLLADVPSKVRKKLNLPERDEGIDLIACDRRGKYWAIQAKWRTGPEQALSLRALATFALKAGVWFRRGRRFMVSPDSRAPARPLSGRNSTYRPVQNSEATSLCRRFLLWTWRGHQTQAICQQSLGFQ
jgi:hypothetical protein